MDKGEIKDYDLFKTLSHPIRIKIIELLHNNMELSYTELLNTLKIDTGQLNFHIKNIGRLCGTTEDGKYILTKEGKIAYGIIKEAKKLSGKEEIIVEPRASVLKRFVASIIDFAFFMGTPPMTVFFASTWIPLHLHETHLVHILGYIYAVLTVLMIALTLMEAYNGQTLGKWIVKIRVIKESGRKLNFMESALRNVAKIFFLPIDVVIGIAFYRKKGHIRFVDYYVKAKVVEI